MDTTKQIQNLVENLIDDSLATRIHQYLKGMCILTFTLLSMNNDYKLSKIDKCDVVFLKGMQREMNEIEQELQDSTNEIQKKKSERVHQLSSGMFSSLEPKFLFHVITNW